VANTPRRSLLPAALGWAVALGVGGLAALGLWDYMRDQAGSRPISWANPLAPWLALGGLLVGWTAFHLRLQRAASMSFSRVDDLVRTRATFVDLFVGLPGALRIVAIAGVAVALGRPQTFREIREEKDSIDIMLVFDLSKSMEETDLPRDRLDAAQRVVRRFLKRVDNDRVGLVVFAQKTMVQCPMTTDMKVLDDIIAGLQLGDIPEYGTAIGDGLGLALTQLRKRDRCATDRDCPGDAFCEADKHRCKSTDPDDPDRLKSKVVILLSDGDSNVAEHFDPQEAARLAKEMKVKVFTILIGQEATGTFGGMGVNPQTMRDIASTTGGQYFNADDQQKFEAGFKAVRETLQKTKRVTIKVVPDKELYWAWLAAAAGALALELVLALTRFRRFP
jgi:Ca-activated chloride channel family protein